jgi:hypothetical protein
MKGDPLLTWRDTVSREGGAGHRGHDDVERVAAIVRPIHKRLLNLARDHTRHARAPQLHLGHTVAQEGKAKRSCVHVAPPV